MTKIRKPTRKAKTTEVATELTQEELDKVSAGAIDSFLNFGISRAKALTKVTRTG